MKRTPITSKLYRQKPVRLLAWAILTLLVLAVGTLELMGWPFLAKPAEQWLSKALEREIRLTNTDESDPQFKLRLIGGIRLRLNHFEVASPSWSQSPFMVKAENVSLGMRYVDLMKWAKTPESALRIRSLTATALNGNFERLKDGRASWQFANNQADSAPAPAPEFGLLAIQKGQIIYRDEPLDLDLDATLSLQEGELGADALTVMALGSYQGKKLQIQLKSTGVLPWVAKQGKPIPVELNVSLGRARLDFKGNAADALGMQQLSGQFAVSGSSLAAAGQALGVTLPNTPAFRTEGNLVRDADNWQVNINNATIGKSRVNGCFVYEGGKTQPLLTGELKGPSLVLADLGPTVGAPAVKQEVATKRQGRVLPDKPFDLPSLRAMDADVKIDIDNLDLGSEILKPLRPLRAHLAVTEGVLTISEIQAKTAKGELAGSVQLDGREDIAVWDVDLNWANVQLEQWLNMPRAGNEPPYVTGTMNGAAKLRGQGRSTAEILGSLAGNVRTQVRNGTMSHLIVEAAGLDAAEALGVWFRGDEVLQMTCAYADLNANNGVLQPRAFVIDTQDSAMWVNGSISMKTEALNLRVVVTPKDFSPVSLRTPLLITGTMGSPDVSLEKGPLAGKVAGAVLLSVLNPFAALIPFVEMGTPDSAENANKTGCYDLAARSKAQREKN
ncbi:AsmA family protein [Limnobacter sp.]|uniref:AsmA family protein n=1 Tax=Limnobacter sp. TaxID=2003368 RepID=UPI00311E17B3